MDWLSTGIKLIVELVRGWLSEFSRDKANRDAGEAQANAEASEAALERAVDAKEAQDDISRLDDDALDKRMRDNRDAVLAKSRGNKT